MSSIATQKLELFETFKNDNGSYDIPKDKFMEILNKKCKKSKKKCASGYMKWLGENRAQIKLKYFDDLNDFGKDYWSIDNKMTYYDQHALKHPKNFKEGKPNVAILVASKAGQIWKSLPQEEREKYNSISKKSVEKENESEDEESINVELYTYKGQKYYLDTDNQILYDMTSEDEIGKIVKGKVIMN